MAIEGEAGRTGARLGMMCSPWTGEPSANQRKGAPHLALALLVPPSPRSGRGVNSAFDAGDAAFADFEDLVLAWYEVEIDVRDRLAVDAHRTLTE